MQLAHIVLLMRRTKVNYQLLIMLKTRAELHKLKLIISMAWLIANSDGARPMADELQREAVKYLIVDVWRTMSISFPQSLRNNFDIFIIMVLVA